MLRRTLLLIFSFFAIASAFADDSRLVIDGTNLATNTEVKLEIGSHKAMVVVFLSARCPCSNSHIRELKDLSERFSDFKFVGIHSNSDEPEGTSADYFRALQLPFPVIQDQNLKWANYFRANRTPHAFVVGKKSERLYQGGVTDSAEISRADQKYLRMALEDIQQGRSVKVAHGRTLGCAIARDNKPSW